MARRRTVVSLAGREGQSARPAPRRRSLAVVGAVTATMVITSAMTFTIAVLAPFLQRDVGLSVFQIGTLAAAVYLVASPASVVAGRVADRFRAPSGVLAMVGCAVAAFALFSWAPGYAVMLLAAAVAGIALALANPVTNQIIVGAFPHVGQGRAVGWKQAGVPLSALLAGSILPSLAAVWGWRLTVLSMAGAMLAAGILSAWLLRDVVASPRHGASATRPGGRGGGLRGLNPLGFLMGVAAGCFNTYLVLYAVETLGFSDATAGMVAAVAGLSGAVLRVVWASGAERRSGPHAALRLMVPIAVLAVLVTLAAPVTAAWTLWIAAVLAGAGISVFNALGMFAILRGAPDVAVGAATGRLSRAFFGGLLIGPVLFGAVVDLTGAYTVGWGLLLIVVVAAVAISRTSSFLMPVGVAPSGHVTEGPHA